jgi:DNA-binding CsgD family transcriptional regulator
VRLGTSRDRWARPSNGGLDDLREAAAYASRARGPRRCPDTGWKSLTPTEGSVVDLAVQGMSNPEIATRLFISRGAAKTHLHVYIKQQIANAPSWLAWPARRVCPMATA